MVFLLFAILGYICLFIFAVWQLWMLLRYILEGISLSKLAKRRGFEAPWLAWVPMARLWLLGAVADQYCHVVKGKDRNRRITTLVLKIVGQYLGLMAIFSFLAACFVNDINMMLEMESEGALLLTFLFLFLSLVALAGRGIAGIGYHIWEYIPISALYASSKPKSARLYLVLSIIFPFLLPFFIFSCRKKDLGMYKDLPADPL